MSRGDPMSATFRSPLGGLVLTVIGAAPLDLDDLNWLAYLASRPHLINARLREGAACEVDRARRPEAAALSDARHTYQHGRLDEHRGGHESDEASRGIGGRNICGGAPRPAGRENACVRE